MLSVRKHVNEHKSLKTGDLKKVRVLEKLLLQCNESIFFCNLAGVEKKK